MSLRARAAAGAVATLALSALTAGNAQAASSLHYLADTQFPVIKEFGKWHQLGATESGTRGGRLSCFDNVLPFGRTSYRAFRAVKELQATQYIVRAADVATAKELVTKAKDRVKTCGKWAGGESDYEVVSYAHQDVKDGLTLRGLFIDYDGDMTRATRFGIGRDGRFVTVVVLEAEQRDDISSTRFAKLAKAALENLQG